MALYLLLDAARAAANIDVAREMNPTNQSLYREKEETVLSLDSVAPFLFSFPQQTPFANWLVQNGWGKAWGVMFQCSPNYKFDDLYRHFRRFLMVKTELGEDLYFRFYDPRVLRIFLPSCDIGQLRDFFGPISHFYCEEKEGGENTLVFSLQGGQLKVDKVESKKLFLLEKVL